MANENKATKNVNELPKSDPLAKLADSTEVLKIALNEVSRKRGEGIRFSVEPQTLMQLSVALGNVIEIGKETGMGANFAMAIVATMLAQ